MLDIGEANSRLRWAEYDRAIGLLHNVTERHPDGAFAPEAIYWHGIADYLKTHDNDQMYAVWRELQDRFPESVWALRIP